MQAKDYYAILGVTKSATPDEIKKAYRKIAKENHPDRNPDDAKAEGRFKEASEAYSIIGDEEKRKRYDALRQYGFGSGGRMGQGFPGGGSPGGFPGGVRFSRGPGGKQYVHVEGDMGDLNFSDLFGENSPFADVFESLLGQMGGGRGQGFGGQAPPRRPPRRPSGRLPREPFGTDDFFTRQGLDVHCVVWLKMEQLEDGTKIKVRTPSGKKAILKVPAGTRIGQKFRLKGLGLTQNGHRGDQYVEVKAVA